MGGEILTAKTPFRGQKAWEIIIHSFTEGFYESMLCPSKCSFVFSSNKAQLNEEDKIHYHTQQIHRKLKYNNNCTLRIINKMNKNQID